jgi:hypothetical protein
MEFPLIFQAEESDECEDDDAMSTVNGHANGHDNDQDGVAEITQQMKRKFNAKV